MYRKLINKLIFFYFFIFFFENQPIPVQFSALIKNKISKKKSPLKGINYYFSYAVKGISFHWNLEIQLTIHAVGA
jgi:hypothetical protein